MGDNSDAPPSTLALFNNILRSAESEAASDGAASSRLRLFRIATKLAKLNLLDDDEGTSNTNVAGVWEIVISFLDRCPDFAVFRPVLDHTGQQQQANGGRQGHDEEQEEMLFWLLPKMLTRLAVSGARVASPATPAAAKQKHKQLGTALEGSVSKIVDNLHNLFYRKEEDGLQKYREVTADLMTVLRALDSQSLGAASYPLRLPVFTKGNRYRKDAGEDPFNTSDGRDTMLSPILIRDKIQGHSLQFSIMRILVESLRLNSSWNHHIRPRVFDALIGQKADWAMAIDKKGKGRAGVLPYGIKERIRMTARVFELQPASNVYAAGHATLLQMLFEVFSRWVLREGAPDEGDAERCDPLEERELVSTLHDGLQAILSQPWLSKHSILSSQVQHFVLDHQESFLRALTTAQDSVLDVSNNTLELTPMQTTSIALLGCFIYRNTETQQMRIVFQSLPERLKSDLVSWLEKQPALTFDVACPKRVQEHLHVVVESMIESLASRTKKRKLDQLDEAGQQNGSILHHRTDWSAAGTAKLLWRHLKVSDSHVEDRGWEAILQETIQGRGTVQDQKGIRQILCALSVPEDVYNENAICGTCFPPYPQCLQGKRYLRPSPGTLLESCAAALKAQAAAKDSKLLAAQLATLASIAEHTPANSVTSFCQMSSETCTFLLQHLNDGSRVVRLAAGRALNAIVKANTEYTASIDAEGSLSRYFAKLDHLIQQGSPSIKTTTFTTVMQLARFTEDQLLSAALGLVVVALAQRGMLRPLVTTQLEEVLAYRGTAAYKLFSPHFDYLCPMLANHLDASNSVLHYFVGILGLPIQAFLRAQGIARLFLAVAVDTRRRDLISFVSKATETPVAELLILNADCIFAPLYFRDGAKFDECKAFVLSILNSSGISYTLPQLLVTNLPALILQILIKAGRSASCAEKLDSVLVRLFQDVNPRLGKAEQLARPVLPIFGRASDLLRGMHGRKSTPDRLSVLRGLEMLVQHVGAQIVGAAPQIMSILQNCLADPPLRHQTLLLWHTFIMTLVFEDVKPILAQTTAAFVQAWSTFRESERKIAKDILEFCLETKRAQLGIAVYSVASLSGIPELTGLQDRLAQSIGRRNFEGRVTGFLERLDTVNEAVLVQALREMSTYLGEESATLHSLASGDSFAPVLGQLVHGLLTTAIRNAESRSRVRSLALQCVGILGALDPDRIVYPTEETSFILYHDLRSSDECIAFSLYVIEKVLLKVLRTTNDPQQQAGLFLAIQGLAAVCGFDAKLRQGGGFQAGVEKHTRERWNKLPKPVQENLEPLIASSIEVEHLEQEKYEYPLYTHTKSYREWLQSWTSDLISHLIKMPMPKDSGYGPRAIFEPFRAAVRRGSDLTVPFFILPYLVFYTVTSGSTSQSSKIRLEIETVLQDQIHPGVSSMTSDSRSLCAQAVFELMDNLNTWIRARTVYLQKKYKKSGKIAEVEASMQPIKKVAGLFKALPQDSVADAAFNSKSFARALLNYEKILFSLKFHNDPQRLQPYYERLHSIYAELDEPDGMEGVSTSILSPSIQHQIRQHEMTGKWTSAQSCWEVQLQLQPEDPQSHLGMLRCLQNLGHYDSLRTHIAGLQSKHEEWQDILAPYAIESALISGDMEELEAALARPNTAGSAAAFGSVVLALRKGDKDEVEQAFSRAAELLGSRITTAGKDSYHRFYDAIVDLHILHEFDTLSRHTLQAHTQRRPSRDDTSALTARLGLTAPTFHARESILNMRRNIIRITTGSNDPNLGGLWLSTSKIAVKAGHLQTAYSAILQAKQLKAEFTFVQSAKLYKANDQLYRALQEVEQGLKELGVLGGAATPQIEVDAGVTEKLAKAVLRSARWMQDTGRFDSQEVIMRYNRAVKLEPSWEAAYYRLGQYADDILQGLGMYQHAAVSSSPEGDTNLEIIKYMDMVVHYYGKALRFGVKCIYQALPRLITVWMELGAFEQVIEYEAIQPATGGAQTSNKRRASAKQPAWDGPATHAMYKRIAAHVRRAQERLPGYMWLSALAQLASRVNHPFHLVHDLLSALIAKIVLEYPQQAIWTMIGQLNSKVTERRERITNMLTRAKREAAKKFGPDSAFSRTEQALTSLVRRLLEVANFPTESYSPLSMSRNFPKLKAMLPCDVIIPFQDSMTVSLPALASTNDILAHKPFPNDLVAFKGFADEIDIMQSVAKPRKLTITGSDNKTYLFLCKPLDDLRKDSRLMECTSLINRFLKKDAMSRKRNLHIRTYAVVPLNEDCGLIEWVPDTAGIRNLWIKAYEPHNIPPWNDGVKKAYEGIKQQQKTDLAKCGKVFSEVILPMYPAVFHEWFLDNFPEPTAWLKARTAYARTAAVMSMVGFVLGLGDRHGENILVDTTNGDVVHVDFNCLFGMGFVWFDIEEKVPFRLTQNVIDGFGITGIEGNYRNCCEVTLRILRENKNSLISVLESFVHDPLLDLQLSKPRGRQRDKVGAAKGETKQQTARREEEGRKEEARGALATISNKLKGLQATTRGEPKETVTATEMTVENLFKEATDPKNLGGMYMGWAAWM